MFSTAVERGCTLAYPNDPNKAIFLSCEDLGAFRARQSRAPVQRVEPMGVLKPDEGEREQMALQEDVMVGSEQERLLLLTSMLGVAEHDLVSTQDRLNAMHQLQLEKDELLMQKERQMGSLYDVRVPPRTDASRPRMHTGAASPTARGVVQSPLHVLPE